MKTPDHLEPYDSIVLIFHPSNAPNFFNSDGVLEFDGESSIALPMQKQFKDAMVKILTEFAAFRQSPVVDVESRLRVDSHNETEFPATYVVRLVGHDIGVSYVERFRAAAQFVVRTFMAQRSIEEIEVEHLLSEEEKDFLRVCAGRIAAKFANKSIPQGFVVRFGPDDPHGVIVQGIMAPLLIEEKLNTTISGSARPMGFDVDKNTVILLCDQAANDPGESTYSKGPIELHCQDSQMLTTLAQAYVNCAEVSFTALVQLATKTKKPVITLTCLQEEKVANDPKSFDLS
jgi:hypothetical protein